MADKKMTYVDALNVAIAIEGLDAEVVEKLTALKGSIEKKSTNRKPTKNQVENATLCDKVVEVLAQMPEGGTASEIIKGSAELNDLSTPKMTALLKMLTETGTVERETVGRKAVYKLAIVPDEDADTDADETAETE